ISVPYATRTRKPKLKIGNLEQSSDYDFSVSDSRKVLAYSFDDVLVCRSTENLQVLWTRNIEEEMRAYKIVLNSNGKYVAAACVDTGFFLSLQPGKRPTKFFVAIYEGSTGKELSRVSIAGTEGIALSPNGDLLAVVVVQYVNKETVPSVHIYDV